MDWNELFQWMAIGATFAFCLNTDNTLIKLMRLLGHKKDDA